MQLNLSSRGLWHILRRHYDLGLRSDIVDAICAHATQADIDAAGSLQLTLPIEAQSTIISMAIVAADPGRDNVTLTEHADGSASVSIQPAEDEMAYL
jgi:hypothetical protein